MGGYRFAGPWMTASRRAWLKKPSENRACWFSLGRGQRTRWNVLRGGGGAGVSVCASRSEGGSRKRKKSKKKEREERKRDARLQPVIAPPLELVADIDDDGAPLDLDRGPRVAAPKLGRDGFARAHLEAVLALALEQERQDVKVGVRAAGGR